ncbi:rhotekin-like [Chiloscyllium plagiosum]|uniref:rhotekin-like n=1 Tax=Chiloscyllium plagiosum TaxID=36176 RepID=UPI001CB80595|nr:rhotekin-like [Chiloscyllium plagiosum]
MWKDTDYFKNKGDFHRYAVFALIKIDCEIYDTEMVMVNRTMTDISFESSFVFSNVGPDFEMKLEIYSCCVEEDFSMASGPKKLANKLSTSLGRSTGKKIRASLDSTGESVMADGGSSPVLLPAVAVEGPKYHLLAQTSLSLAAIHNNVCTQSLNRLGNVRPQLQTETGQRGVKPGGSEGGVRVAGSGVRVRGQGPGSE